MSYLLLKNPLECPKCRMERVPQFLPAVCRCCGMMLFKSTDSFKRYEQETGWREYWVFFPEDGWKHSTQIVESKALEREVKDEKLPDNYGTPEYVNEKIANSRTELKQALKKHKSKGKTVKVVK